MEDSDFGHSFLHCYQLLQLVALKPQFIAFIQLEQLPKGFESFVDYLNFYASANYRKVRSFVFLKQGLSNWFIRFSLMFFFRYYASADVF